MSDCALPRSVHSVNLHTLLSRRSCCRSNAPTTLSRTDSAISLGRCHHTHTTNAHVDPLKITYTQHYPPTHAQQHSDFLLARTRRYDAHDPRPTCTGRASTMLDSVNGSSSALVSHCFSIVLRLLSSHTLSRRTHERTHAPPTCHTHAILRPSYFHAQRILNDDLTS